MEKKIENNIATLSGTLVSEFNFHHELFGEKFYVAFLQSERLSGVTDTIPVTVSENLIDVNVPWKGCRIRVFGQFRSHREHINGKSHLQLTLYVKDFEAWGDNREQRCADENSIILDGYYCKNPIFRQTPLGKEIAEVLVAVNRPYGKSDYIPCICWGRKARFAIIFPVGTNCIIKGRMQSREYKKKFLDGTCENRVAYEISVSKMEVIR